MTQLARILRTLDIEAKLADARIRLDGMLIQNELGNAVNEMDWAYTVAEISELERELAGKTEPEPEPEFEPAYWIQMEQESLRRGEG